MCVVYRFLRTQTQSAKSSLFDGSRVAPNDDDIMGMLSGKFMRKYFILVFIEQIPSEKKAN
jgi:hypothetical protein